MASNVDKNYKGRCAICKKPLFESDSYIMVKSNAKPRHYCCECYKRIFKNDSK